MSLEKIKVSSGALTLAWLLGLACLYLEKMMSSFFDAHMYLFVCLLVYCRGSLHRMRGDYNAAIDDFVVAVGKCGLDETCEVFREGTRQLVLTYNELAVDCFQ